MTFMQKLSKTFIPKLRTKEESEERSKPQKKRISSFSLHTKRSGSLDVNRRSFSLSHKKSSHNRNSVISRADLQPETDDTVKPYVQIPENTNQPTQDMYRVQTAYSAKTTATSYTGPMINVVVDTQVGIVPRQ